MSNIVFIVVEFNYTTNLLLWFFIPLFSHQQRFFLFRARFYLSSLFVTQIQQFIIFKHHNISVYKHDLIQIQAVQKINTKISNFTDKFEKRQQQNNNK